MDQGSEAAGWDDALSVLARVDRELGEVEDALRRLDEGSYGSCEACGRPLADERLEADPLTRRCPEHGLPEDSPRPALGARTPDTGARIPGTG